MCGIFFTETNDLTEEILQGFKTLQTRGPDNTNINLINDLFGFTRLCIIDKSDDGNQPFQDNNITMVCNGEIYNHKNLIEKYNLKCNSNSDCEVILRLFQHLGSFHKTIKELDGVYAVILSDQNNVWFARDPIGVRPMFFSKNNILSIASLAKALTPFNDDVTMVKPGVCYVYDKLTQEIKQEDNIIYQFPSSLITEEDKLIKTIHDTLSNSVKKRLMSDRPIGCLLSGGLDSSIIASLLCKFLGSSNVRTYSIGMEGGLDIKYARMVAKHLDTIHTEIMFTPEEGISAIPEVIYNLESYDVTTVRASVGMYLLCKYISKCTKDIVIFSGEGSDELFSGYLYFHNAPNPQEARVESNRLIQELYKYDVLRSDRMVSCHGLELRVPFLDFDVLTLATQNTPDEWRRPINGWEKYFLRKAFQNYLPKEIVWRRKDGFSDAVSSLEKPWYTYIQDFVDTKITNEMFNPNKYMSKEDMYYKLIFEHHFPNYNLNLPTWMPKWSGNLKDPSGRLIKAFDEKQRKG